MRGGDGLEFRVSVSMGFIRVAKGVPCHRSKSYDPDGPIVVSDQELKINLFFFSTPHSIAARG